jgi:hypothetical protein
VKLPSGESLHRVVAVLQRRACMKDAKPSAGAADSLRSLVQLLGCFVRIPFTPEEADPVPGTLIQQSMDSASRDSAAAGLSSASTITSDESLRGLKLASVSAAAASPTAASLSAANTAKQTEPSQPVQGSQRSAPTLRAVFIAAAVEACTLALCVAAPLLSALLEEHGLGAVAEHAEAATFRRRLYLPAQCAVLVLGALVQVAALALAAGYLLHRGTIALEVRNVLAAGNAVGAASKPALLSGMQRAVLQRVCAVFDCGARTVCNAHVGAVCRSDADEFACGVPNPGTGAMQTPAGGGKAVTGRGKAAAGRNAALATQPPLPQRLQCYVLNLALLSVLGVAGGLLALVLARWTGRVSKKTPLLPSNPSCLYIFVDPAARDRGLRGGQRGVSSGGDGAQGRCTRRVRGPAAGGRGPGSAQLEPQR